MTGASIWTPGDSETIPTANADNSYMTQSFLGSDGVVTGGNTVFTLTDFAYVIATGSLDVYVNGVHQDITDDFTETSSTVVTIIGLLEAGDEITIRGLIGGTAAVAAEVSATASAVSAAASLAAYDAILGLGLPSLPLAIAEGGTGQDTAAEAFLALAPAPVVNKVMGSTDGVSWTAVDVIVPGTGGAEIVTNVTLIATSDGAQSMTPTDYGRHYKLPDATTMSEGTNRFSLGNSSPYPVKILTSTDVNVGFIPAFSAVYVSLVSNATAAGVWSLSGAVQIALTSKTLTTGLTATITSSIVLRVVIDATRTMIITGGGGSNCHARVHDSSTNTWGAVVLVRAAINYVQAVLSAANQVLIVSCNATTGMESVTLSIVGVTITLNAAVATVIASNVSSISALIVVGIYIVIGYTRTTGGAIRGISIAGTAPTIGAETALTGTVTTSHVRVLPVTATVFIATSFDAVTFYAKPFTLSAGPALAAGTEASFNCSQIPRIYAQNGRWFVATNSGNLLCRILSIAGTVASVTAAVTAAAHSQAMATFTDAYVLGNKLVIAYNNNNTVVNFSTFIDTAGVLTLGGTVSANLNGNLAASLLAFIFASGNTIVFAANQTAMIMWKIDASGAAPVISTTRAMDESSTEVGTPAPSSIEGTRNQLLLRSTNIAYTLTSTSAERVTGYIQNELFILRPLDVDVINTGVSGYENETWLVTTAIGDTGLVICRIECATY